MEYSTTLSSLGRYREAEEGGKKAMEVHSEVYGPLHKKTLDAKKNYADILRSMGKKEEALEVY